MKRVLAAALVLGLASEAFAADPVVPNDTYVGGLVDFLAAPGSKRVPKLDNGFGAELLYGSREPGGLPWGLGYEFNVYYDVLKPKKTTGVSNRRRTGGAADVTYPFRSIALGPIMPYALGGLGLVYSNDVSDLSNEFNATAEVGGGVVTKALMSWGLRARAEVKYVYENVDKGYGDVHVLAGVELPLGSTMPPPAPEPVKVVEPAAAPAEPAPAAEPAPVDSDGDGVPDDKDKCPNTPQGEAVDADGCPSTIKKVLTLKGVTFEVNSDVLKPESDSVLDEAAKTLNNEYPDAKVEVAGHTDSSGKAEYNMELSRRRAESVRKYLVEHGVDAGRLTSAGYGMTQPVADNKTKGGKAKNRRVELRIK